MTSGNNEKAEKERVGEQAAAKAQIATLKDSIDTGNSSHRDDTKLFLDKLDKLKDQLSLLENDQKTRQLKQQIVNLQETLKATDTASAEVVRMHSAAFSFGFGEVPPEGKLSSKITLPSFLGVVSVDIKVWNSSDVTASTGEIFVRICGSCKFVEEPEHFIKIKDSEDTERVMPFQVLGPRTKFQTIRLKVLVPQQLPAFDVGTRYSCQTCVENDFQILRVTLQPQPLSRNPAKN